ncbi:hypothetical protein [Microbulbifer hydrolyticus]|uniref:Uncharacterized protein n=1 Tax=Microbulbifer hydrolyticus TaxID=48074 RepID=A0A6P1TET8_9GAMM|nr:hypothetical protein [Microbulbifer hydrolyticus]MBB5212554.1 hypothetical protein [Microbulbifer hydrolyticus]QHQ40173.1 hypothetical protein GTQ55_15085 [Microbulbifer hydrolyticus]
MSDFLKHKAKFLSDYQASLIIKAIKGSDFTRDEDRNFYNTRKEGEEYEAWLSIERLGLATKKEFKEDYYVFKLSAEGVKIAEYLDQARWESDDIPF